MTMNPADQPSEAAEHARIARYLRFLELHALAAVPEVHQVPLTTLEEYQSLLVEFGVYRVAGVFVGPFDPTRTLRTEPISNVDCIPIPGAKPLVCPRSSPRLPVELLPDVEGRFRSLRLVGPGETVLWVGRQASMETLCMYRQGCSCFAETTRLTGATERGEGGTPPAVSAAVAPPAAQTPTGTAPPADDRRPPLPLPDGPFGANDFRFRGIEVQFGRAKKQYDLLMAMWDRKNNRPAPARPVQDVIDLVWGADNDTDDARFRQLIADTRGRLQRASCPLGIEHSGGKVWLKVL